MTQTRSFRSPALRVDIPTPYFRRFVASGPPPPEEEDISSENSSDTSEIARNALLAEAEGERLLSSENGGKAQTKRLYPKPREAVLIVQRAIHRYRADQAARSAASSRRQVAITNQGNVRSRSDDVNPSASHHALEAILQTISALVDLEQALLDSRNALQSSLRAIESECRADGTESTAVPAPERPRHRPNGEKRIPPMDQRPWWDEYGQARFHRGGDATDAMQFTHQALLSAQRAEKFLKIESRDLLKALQEFSIRAQFFLSEDSSFKTVQNELKEASRSRQEENYVEKDVPHEHGCALDDDNGQSPLAKYIRRELDASGYPTLAQNFKLRKGYRIDGAIPENGALQPEIPGENQAAVGMGCPPLDDGVIEGNADNSSDPIAAVRHCEFKEAGGNEGSWEEQRTSNVYQSFPDRSTASLSPHRPHRPYARWVSRRVKNNTRSDLGYVREDEEP